MAGSSTPKATPAWRPRRPAGTGPTPAPARALRARKRPRPRAPPRRRIGRANLTMRLEITIANRQRSLRLRPARLRRILSQVLRAAGRGGELSVALVDDREMQRVNREFL